MIDRATKTGALYNMVKLGFRPTTVIDVGVSHGTPELYAAFPKSVHILIEPIAEHEPHLKSICEQLEFATYIIAAAAEQTGEAMLRVSDNAMYSSVTSSEGSQVEVPHYQNRTIQTIAIDDLARQSNLAGPAVLKIDVDGSELNVLKGSVSFLSKVECVIVEATLFGQFQDVMNFMTIHNFVLYDIVDHLFRPLDGALWQVDLIFVPKNSKLRSETCYADEETIRTLTSD